MDVRTLYGRSAMVSGAASGIGREPALALARRGADLFICDVNEAGPKQTHDAIVANALGIKASERARRDLAGR